MPQPIGQFDQSSDGRGPEWFARLPPGRSGESGLSGGAGPPVGGAALAATGVAASAGAWWCAAAPERVVVLCEPPRRARLLQMLRTAARPLAGVHVHDASAALSAVAVVGRCAMSVLSALEALGPENDPRSAPPFARVRIADADVCVLLQSD